MSPQDATPTSDEELVEQARDGRVRALDELLTRHQAKVLRVLAYLGIPAADREDVAQEVFLRVFRHLATFRRGQVFGGWIYRVTVNAAHDWRTRHGRQARDEAPWVDEADPPDEAPGPAETLRRRELERDLLAALDTLSDRERAVFVLRELEGLETRNVARALGITTITVRRHLGRARRHLREALGKGAGEKTALGVERIAPDGGR